MAPSLKLFIAVMAMAALADVAFGKNYTVGEPTGKWDLATDYVNWVKDKKFYPGDVLIFKYTPAHDVAEVTKGDYTSCSYSPSNAISYDKSGNTAIELKTDGTRYFLCAVPTHCTSGMKIQIDVLPKSTSPPAPKSPSPPTPKSSPTPTLPPTSLPPAISPATPPASNAMVVQQGVAVIVLGLIGLIFVMW